MSLTNIFNKLTLEEIRELAESFNEQQSNFFGNKLKQSKNKMMIAKVLGIKNWSTLVVLKEPLGLKVEGVNNKLHKASYKCPSCGSSNFHCVIDSYDYQKIDSKGNLVESNFIAHMDDRKYQCSCCDYESFDIRLTYEIELDGFDTSGDKDHLILWINIGSSQDYSFEKLLQENKNVKSFKKIPYQSDGVDLKYDIFREKSEINNLINSRVEVE